MSVTLPTGRAGHAIALGLVLVVLGLAWLAIASPLIGWYNTRAETLSERRLFAARLTGLAASLPALEQAERRLAATAPARNALLAGSTNAIAAATLQQTVQTLATGSRATLSSAETPAAQKVGRYWRIRLRVSVGGSFPILVHLLRAITTGKPTMLIDNLRLTGSGMPSHTAAAPLTAIFTVIAFRTETAHPSGVKSGKPDVVK